MVGPQYASAPARVPAERIAMQRQLGTSSFQRMLSNTALSPFALQIHEACCHTAAPHGRQPNCHFATSLPLHHVDYTARCNARDVARHCGLGMATRPAERAHQAVARCCCQPAVLPH
jgi:hypothetical protein